MVTYTAEESNVDFEIGVNAPATLQFCRLRKISYRACDFLLFGHYKITTFLSIIWLPDSKL